MIFALQMDFFSVMMVLEYIQHAIPSDFRDELQATDFISAELKYRYGLLLAYLKANIVHKVFGKLYRL